MRKIIDYHGNEVSEEFARTNISCQYLYDSAEKALIDLIIGDDCLNIHFTTRVYIDKVSKAIEYKGIILNGHFEWKGYLFEKTGSFYKCLGKMR